MRSALLAVVVMFAIAACSRVTQENFLKVREGMAEEEVIAILGQPTESNSVNLLGVSGTSSRWVARGAVISVQFVNGKVALKSFESK